MSMISFEVVRDYDECVSLAMCRVGSPQCQSRKVAQDPLSGPAVLRLRCFHCGTSSGAGGDLATKAGVGMKVPQGRRAGLALRVQSSSIATMECSATSGTRTRHFAPGVMERVCF